MEQESLVQSFLYDNKVRFVNRGIKSGSELELIIKCCPITGVKLPRYRSRKVLSGRTINQAFEELWEEMVSVLGIEPSPVLNQLKIIARHSVTTRDSRHVSGKRVCA